VVQGICTVVKGEAQKLDKLSKESSGIMLAADLMSPPGGEKAKHCRRQYLLSSCIRRASTAATPAPRLWPVKTSSYS